MATDMPDPSEAMKEKARMLRRLLEDILGSAPTTRETLNRVDNACAIALESVRAEAAKQYEIVLENYRNAWVALRMVREALEGEAVGALPSGEHTGVSPTDEAHYLVAAILCIRAEAVAAERERAAKPVADRVKELGDLLDRGQGTHGQPGYVRDSVWDSWCGQYAEASRLLCAIRGHQQAGE